MSAARSSNALDYSAIGQRIRQAAWSSNNEEELRTSVEHILTDSLNDLDIETHRAQEYTTVEGGRIDALYGDVIVEYKEPGTFASSSGIESAIYGRNEDDRGLHDYLFESATKDTYRGEDIEEALGRKVGVGLDGERIFFYRYRPDTEVIPMPAGQTTLIASEDEDLAGSFERIDVSSIDRGVNRLMLYLRSLSRYPLNAEVLVNEFGLQSEMGSALVKKFYENLEEALEDGNPQVETLYQQWDRMFGVVYDPEAGGDRFTHRDDVPEFGGEEVETQKFLFAAHTYFSFLLELIGLELLSSLEEPFIISEDFLTLNDSELRSRLEKLEQGEMFRVRGIERFFEGGYFQWYLECWDEELATEIRGLLEHLEQFDSATTVIRPETARDILKELYQDIVPNRLRHNLGEYFTPDWLSHRVCDVAEYRGDPGERVLDPACGSGTFLVEAIGRVRDTIESRDDEISPKEELHLVLKNIVGFDVNPVSVITAKTNYLLALGELALEADGVSLPIYGCDSILAPQPVSDLSNGGYYRVTNTSVGEFDLPKLGSQSDLQTSMDRLSAAIDDDEGADTFLAELRSRDIEYSEQDEALLRCLYTRIEDLDEDDRDGIWPRLLSSSFAPVFEDDFDYVIGNPPWISWDSLSESYKDQTEDLWEEIGLYDTYQGDKDDICLLMTYVVIDRHLDDSGCLCFLLPQSVWQSKEGADDFRQFEIPQVNSKPVSLSVPVVEDFSSFQPFEAATNHTSIGLFKKGDTVEYPVDYNIWTKADSSGPAATHSWAQASQVLDQWNWAAKPVDPADSTSPWLILSSDLLDAFDPVLGDSFYQAREGINTRGRTGIYRVDVFEADEEGLIAIQNDPSQGRKKLSTVRRPVKPDLIYPLLRGEDLEGREWSINKYAVVPHTQQTGMAPIPLEEMIECHNETLEFFREFKSSLADRSSFRYAQPGEDVFYQLYEIGSYTFSDYKVVWPHVRSEFSAGVLSPHQDPKLGDSPTPIIPDKQLMIVACDTEDEANYLAGILNSGLCKLLVNRLMIATQISTYLLEYLDVPQYRADDDTHTAVADAFDQLDDQSGTSNDLRSDLDEAVMEVFGLSEAQADDIYEALAITNEMRS
jgi:hypothetical protein